MQKNNNNYSLYEVTYLESGVPKELIVSARTITDARKSAAGYGFYDIIAVKKHITKSLMDNFGFGASNQVKESFLNRLKFYLESGDSEYAALKMMVKEESDTNMKRKLAASVNLLEKGMGFSDALLVLGIFSADDISFLSAGEMVGYLSAIRVLLSRIDQSKGFKQLVKAFMGFVIIEGTTAITLPPSVAWQVVPWVKGFIADMSSSIEPNSMAQLMADLEAAKMNNIYLFVATLIVIIGFFMFTFIKNASEKNNNGSIFLAIPVVGEFVRHAWLVSQSKAIGMLLDNGVSLPDALTLLGSKDKKFPNFWKIVNKGLERGLLVHDAFRKGGIMFESDIGMIQSHKNVKHLSQIFHKLSDYHADRQSELQRRLLSLGTMFFFAYIGIVLFVSLGVYQVFSAAMDMNMTGLMSGL
jgi:type II secretory pathway component PulF